MALNLSIETLESRLDWRPSYEEVIDDKIECQFHLVIQPNDKHVGYYGKVSLEMTKEEVLEFVHMSKRFQKMIVQQAIKESKVEGKRYLYNHYCYFIGRYLRGSMGYFKGSMMTEHIDCTD